MLGYSKEDQNRKEEKEKKVCKVTACNILEVQDGFCKGHYNAIFNKKKPRKVERKKGKRRTKKELDNDWQWNFDKAKESFQRWVRAKWADKHGVCVCVSTGKFMKWEGANCQGGHFIGANYRATTFTEENCHPQSAMANNSMGLGRAEENYRLWMIKQYGEDFVDRLRIASRQERKYAISELKEIKAKYDFKLCQEVKKKGLVTSKNLPKLRKDYQKRYDDWVVETKNDE